MPFTELNAPPQKIPQKIFDDPDLLGFFEDLILSMETMYNALGGIEGVPTMLALEDTATAYDETTPDGFSKMINEAGDEVVVPYWNT